MDIPKGNFMRFATIAIAALLSFSSFHSFANSANVVDPMTIESNDRATAGLLGKALDFDSIEERYEGVKSFLNQFGEWVTLEGQDGYNPRIHISSYLLKTGHEDIAAALLKNGEVEGWVSYKFLDGIVSDYQFAVEDGHLDYLKTLFSEQPSGINSTLPLLLDGTSALPMAILASSKYQSVDGYEEIIYSMLQSGANPHQKMASGISPMIVASSENNVTFVRVVQNFLESQSSDVALLLSNTPLESHEMIEMQAIADTLIEEGEDYVKKIPLERLHDMWIQMILKGYNTPADLIYDLIKDMDGFELELRTKKGMDAMMAASLSTLYGGNVEYAQLLLKRGFNPNRTISIDDGDGGTLNIGYIQLAFQKDNYKTVTALISGGANFVHAPDAPDLPLIAEAYEQKAFMSASVIKYVMGLAYEQRQGTKGVE